MDQDLVDTIVRWFQELSLEFVVGTSLLFAICLVVLVVQGPLSRSRDGEKPPDDPGGGGGSSRR